MWLVRQHWTRLSEADQQQLLPRFRPSPAREQDYRRRQVLTGIFNRPFTNARALDARARWGEQGVPVAGTVLLGSSLPARTGERRLPTPFSSARAAVWWQS